MFEAESLPKQKMPLLTPCSDCQNATNNFFLEKDVLRAVKSPFEIMEMLRDPTTRCKRLVDPVYRDSIDIAIVNDKIIVLAVHVNG